jgi:DNA-binding NtrC family response regulator
MQHNEFNEHLIQNILVVDDEENTRACLTELLASEGYRVASAGDGVEALNCLQGGDYQLVITDINMPRMNGMAFLDQLNRDHPELDVIMVTAFGGVDSYVQAMKQGVYEYLHKPVKLEDLRSVMQKLSLEKSELT